jgi:hypothetical protein
MLYLCEVTYLVLAEVELGEVGTYRVQLYKYTKVYILSIQKYIYIYIYVGTW